MDNNTTTALRPIEAGNLVNVNKAEIKNTGKDKAVYFVFELRDLKDSGK